MARFGDHPRHGLPKENSVPKIVFAEKVPSQFLCSQCKEFLTVSAFQHSCGHRFCQVCKNALQTARQKCPFDGKAMDVFFRDGCCEREIRELDVLCLNDPLDEFVDGCTWRGKLRHLSAHLDEQCDFVLVRCTHLCDEKVPRGSLAEHAEQHCRNRPIECENCQENMPFFSIRRHLSSECPKSTVSCQFCLEELIREDLIEHIQSCRRR